MAWDIWIGKTVFVQLKSGGYYNGKIVDMDTNSPPLVFLTLIDKYQERVMFEVSEIVKIKEEKDENLQVS